jgi:formyltetrahydrofolate deformylase
MEGAHHDMPDDLIRKGRDIECRASARAIGLFTDDRVVLNGSKALES